MSDQLTRRRFLRRVSTGAVGLGLTTQFLRDTLATVQEWKAGLARAIITPQKSLWMAGYASRKRPSDFEEEV